MSINAMIFPQELFSVSTSGSTLTLARATKTANQFYASSGTTGTTTPSFRAIVLADLPTQPYGEMYMYDNTVSCAIDTVSIYHAVYNQFGNNDGVLPAHNDTNSFTYLAGLGKAISSFANATTGTFVTTSAAHTLTEGQPITITGTTNYNGTYLVGTVTATNSFFVAASYVAEAGGAGKTVRRPATLRALVAGIYRASFNVVATPATNNDEFKFELNKNASPKDNIGSRNTWGTTSKFNAVASMGLMDLVAGDYVWLSVKNYSGANAITIRQCNVSLNRV
jgi:hypothetical protein